MSFTKITVYTTEDNLELLTSQLDDLGAEGFEFGEEDGHETITIYIPQVTDCSKIIAFLKSECLKHTVGEVNEADWENEWKKYFKPLLIGEHLVIKPSWEEYDNPDNKIVLEIDPASAFGTGQHATTRLALELLEKHVSVGDCVLDIGCGSGILSAAASILGAKTIAAIDVCENAVKITKETLEINKIKDYKLYCGNVTDDVNLLNNLCSEIGSDFDVVVANIVADVIIAMYDVFIEVCLSSASKLILSGIIAPRLPEVLSVIEPKFNIIETRESEEWYALVCHRK
jgi:ribosomal protein L11 methyltransferase